MGPVRYVAWEGDGARGGSYWGTGGIGGQACCERRSIPAIKVDESAGGGSQAEATPPSAWLWTRHL